MVELPIHHAQSGEQRWLRFSANHHQDAADTVRFDGQVVDITAERRGENALLAVRNQLHSITSSVPGVVFQLPVLARPVPAEFPLRERGLAQPAWTWRPRSCWRTSPCWRLGCSLRIEPKFTDALRRAVDGMQPWHAEFRINDADGGVKRVRVVATPAEEITDDHVTYNGIITDATDAHRAASRLASAEQRFQELSVALPGLVFQAHVGPDGTGQVTYISAGVEDIYGVSQEEAQADPSILERHGHPGR